jgi:hypothetical protein
VENHKKRWEGPTKKCHLAVVDVDGVEEDVQETSKGCTPWQILRYGMKPCMM